MKRKVLITGVAGFIGSRLAEHLNAMGYEVLGCDIYNFRNQFFDVGDSNHLILQRLRFDRIAHFLQRNQIQYQSIDLSDHGAVMSMFESFKPDVVVHLAAQAGVRHSVKSPMDFVKSNLNGFANVLDACKHCEVQEFLYASSSSVYGSRTDAPFKETDRCDTPESFYAATKIANEVMAQAYFAQYKTPSLGLRFFTVYGPWGRLDMAPILFAQKMRKKQAIQLFGDGLLKRDFTFVGDTVFAITRLI
jgi:UDP-glucuronate 4-epimerase